MRQPVSADDVRRFLEGLGRRARGPGRLYLTGGATAVLHGWRSSTVDIDIKLDPEPAGAFEAIAALKDELHVNVELASPDQFIPELSGWRDRSLFVGSYGPIDALHYDPSAQALAKLERGHARDLEDVRAMLSRGLVDVDSLKHHFESVRPRLIRFPAISEDEFARKVDDFLGGQR